MIDKLKKLNNLFSKKNKIYFGLLIFLMLIGSIFELLGIGAIPAFLTTMSDPKVMLEWPVVGTLLRYFDLEEADQIFLASSVAIVVVYLLKNAYLSGIYYFKAKFTQNRRVELGKKLFTRYMQAPYIFHLGRNSSELLRNTCVEVRILCLEVLDPLLQLVLNIIMVTAIVSLLFVIEPLISLAILGTLGLACLLFLKTVRSRVERYGKEEQRQRKVEYQAVNEGLGGLKDARILGTESFFIQNYVVSSIKTAAALLFKNMTNKLNRPVMEVFAVSGMIALAVLLQNMGREGASIIPTLGLFGIAILKLQMNLTQLASNFTTLKYNLYSVDPVYDDIFALKKLEKVTTYSDPDNNRDDREVKKLRFDHSVRVEGLSYAYPDAKETVLRDINLEIKKGTSVGFVGPTGSGKTTLINILLGLLEPAGGHVKVDGTDIWANIDGWQRLIGFIPQHIYLADQTIRHNVAFGRQEEEIDEERLHEALRIAQLDGFVGSLDAQWNTVIGENGVRISGGQRQRLGIARAAYGEPEILVMDEGTSSLDNNTEAKVMRAIREAGKGKTKIIVAHRLNTVKNCDKIFFLKDGRIENSGTFEELIDINKEFREMSLQGS